ncbi:MAG: baseplate J/gp47 family protein, partial [Bradymonadaceae bacterium]
MNRFLRQLDIRDEGLRVAEALDGLPETLSDRNRASIEAKLLEGGGTAYGFLLWMLARIPESAAETAMERLGFSRQEAKKATVTLEFQAEVGVSPTVEAGTIVQTDAVEPIRFETDSDVTVPSGQTATVDATALEEGPEGNVGADTLVEMATPDPDIHAVTNPSAATGGQDRETIEELIERVRETKESEGASDEHLVTPADYAAHLKTFDGIERAITFMGQGTATSHVVDTDLNEPVAGTRNGFAESLVQPLASAGAVAVVHHPPVRLVQIVEIEIEYNRHADRQATDQRIESTLADHIDAFDWPHGRPLYRNVLVDLVDDLEGVRRVGDGSGLAVALYVPADHLALVVDLDPVHPLPEPTAVAAP